MLGSSIPVTASPCESNPEGVVLLLRLTTAYVACMFFVFCCPLVLAAFGSTSFSSFKPGFALPPPLMESISDSEAPPTLVKSF